ncbi:MAG: peptidylprolyl isomerase [Ferruginibacter sp.]
MSKFFLSVLVILFFSCNNSGSKNPQLKITTGYGDIIVELYPKQAPKTVAAFLSYIDSGYYINSSFYRVILLEGLSPAGNVGLIQGGIYNTNDKKFPNVPGIEHESTKQTGLTHTSGTISLARTTPGTANTEFFICIGDQSQFDYGKVSEGDSLGFAAFGKVINGMPVVRKIQDQKKHEQRFNEKIAISKIERF